MVCVRVVCFRLAPGDRRLGAVAQLVARLVRNEKVRGSNPLSSTDTETPVHQRNLRLVGQVFTPVLLLALLAGLFRHDADLAEEQRLTV